MRKVKSLLKQTTPLQICFAPFLNSPEEEDDLARRPLIDWKTVFALTQINLIDSRSRLGYVLLFGPRERGGHVQEKS